MVRAGQCRVTGLSGLNELIGLNGLFGLIGLIGLIGLNGLQGVPAMVATATTFIPASKRVAVASRAVAPVVTMSSIRMTGVPGEGRVLLTENAPRTRV